MQQLDYNNGNGVFLRGQCRDVISKGRQMRVSSTWEAVKRASERMKLKNPHC
jgi:hypothetical protein